MDLEISEEELQMFLKEAGVLKKPAEIQIEKEESLDKLLDEIMGLTPISDSPQSIVQEKIDSFFPGKEKPKRARFLLLPLFISIAFLGGIFLGSIFGFYWGKTQRVETQVSSFAEIDAKITLLVQQIQEIYNTITPITPPEEIIEPIAPETEIEKKSHMA